MWLIINVRISLAVTFLWFFFLIKCFFFRICGGSFRPCGFLSKWGMYSACVLQMSEIWHTCYGHPDTYTWPLMRILTATYGRYLAETHHRLCSSSDLGTINTASSSFKTCKLHRPWITASYKRIHRSPCSTRFPVRTGNKLSRHNVSEQYTVSLSIASTSESRGIDKATRVSRKIYPSIIRLTRE